MKKQNKWLDNFGKADNANESNVSLSDNFNGLAYDTSYRDYSPAWGGQFQQGGSIPGSVGFTYARTAGSAPSEGKYEKKTMPSAQNGKEMQFYQKGLDWKPKSISRDGSVIKDNQGYWNPDNWGKPVEIDSNDITMRGVYEPLLGISDMGDVQYMTPGNDYKFKGSKVTEFPVAQTGKNVDKATFASAFPYVARKTMQFMGVPLPVRTLSADLIGATDTIDESDLNEEELKALQAIVRKNLAKGKTTIEYPDYETSESPYSDVSSVGFSKIMDKLDDPNYRLKTTIGQANILTTNGDTLVVDKYDFNDKGKRNVEQLIDNIKKRDAYQTLRTVGSIWGSGPEDESSKIEIKTSNNNERDWINSGPQFGRYAGMSVFNKKKNGGTVGINDLDAQPMKKLNQLLNFTNNPDKTNWLDKYQ